MTDKKYERDPLRNSAQQIDYLIKSGLKSESESFIKQKVEEMVERAAKLKIEIKRDELRDTK